MNQRNLLTIAATVFALTAVAQPNTTTGIKTYHGHYSEWMANSVSTTAYWHYDVSLQAESQMDTWLAYPDDVTSKVKNAVNSYAGLVNSSGKISNGYWGTLGKVTELDNIRPGHFIMEYYNKVDGKESSKYTKACSSLLDNMGDMNRTLEDYEYGPWEHKASYPQQVWLDGIFMGLPFYTLAGPEINVDDADMYFDDAASQMHLTDSVTYDSETRLWKHAWDETKSMDWATKNFNKPYAAKEAADKTSGRSAHTWGRALGWYGMACMEVLDNMEQFGVETSDSRYQTVLNLFQRIMASVVDYQDSTSGLWYDVMDVDKNDPDYASLSVKRQNYLEATCSSMFTFSLLKGVRKGWLTNDGDRNYLSAGKKAYTGIVKTLLTTSGNNLQLTNCCEVGGLGGSKNRDGSYAYYMSENVKNNDPKGTGPFIWASLEAEQIDYDMASNTFPEPVTAIQRVDNASKTAVSSEYFTVGGQRTSAHTRGLIIKRTHYSDGSTRVEKLKY